VHDAADVGSVTVDVGVRGGVARRRELAVDQLAVQVADHDGVRGQLVVAHPAGLDDQQVVAGHPGRDVARVHTTSP
jgi:hypothetical protein